VLSPPGKPAVNMGDQSGFCHPPWNHNGSVCSAKEGTFPDRRLVVVSWHACAGDWARASRMAGTRRPLHLSAAGRPLYSGDLDGSRFDPLVALSTDTSGRWSNFHTWCFKLARTGADILLAQ